MVIAEAATGMPAGTALELCRVLADPTRFRLMTAIWREEQCVCDLRSSAGDRPQNLVSHHLGVLRRSGLVDTRRDGRWIYYRPADRLAPGTEVALVALLGPRGVAGGGGATRCS